MSKLNGQAVRRDRSPAYIPPITTHPERLGGTPVIGISRVPVAALLDYFAEGHDLNEFLDDFPSINETEAVAALDWIKEVLETGVPLATPVNE